VLRTYARSVASSGTFVQGFAEFRPFKPLSVLPSVPIQRLKIIINICRKVKAIKRFYKHLAHWTPKRRPRIRKTGKKGSTKFLFNPKNVGVLHTEGVILLKLAMLNKKEGAIQDLLRKNRRHLPELPQKKDFSKKLLLPFRQRLCLPGSVEQPRTQWSSGNPDTANTKYKKSGLLQVQAGCRSPWFRIPEVGQIPLVPPISPYTKLFPNSPENRAFFHFKTEVEQYSITAADR